MKKHYFKKPQPKPIRAFFAIELDPKTRILLTKIINFLKDQPESQYIRWTHPENLHITLRFLGNIQVSQQSILTQQITRAIRGSPPFKIEIGSIGLFPSKIKPHVIAVDIGYSQVLQNLLAAIEKTVIEIGFPAEERLARPHITLGRLKGRRVPNLEIDLSATKTEMLVTEVILYQSQLTKQGSIYTPLERIKF